MTMNRFPELHCSDMRDTRDALHAYSRIVGAWLKLLRPRRKHWWHASLRPSLRGLSTGVVHRSIEFEFELDFVNSLLRMRTPESETRVALHGQTQKEIAGLIDESLMKFGLEPHVVPGMEVRQDQIFTGYSAEQATLLHRSLSSVSSGLQRLRAEIREETSPIQLWPHHFDLSMIWLPGPKIEGQDPANEEYADKQMNFGFTLGDEGVAEPYFYITAYPLFEGLPNVELPVGSEWKSEGFTGAVLLYRDLLKVANPDEYLQDLWSVLLAAGRKNMISNN